MSRKHEAGLAIFLAAGALLAAPPPSSLAAEGSFELGGESASLTDGLGSWQGVHGLLAYVASPRDRLGLELAYASRFDEQGLSGTGTWQREYDEDAYQVFSLTASSAALFWPSVGASTEYLRKVGQERVWVLGVGGGVNGYRTGNDDIFGVLEVVRYLPAGWVIDAGLRVNVSMPGQVTAPRAFAALSWIPAAGHEYVLKVDGGDEAYQLVGPDEVRTRFQSIGLTGEAFVPLNAAATVRLHARLERYMNPFYDRWLGYLGVALPLFGK